MTRIILSYRVGFMELKFEKVGAFLHHFLELYHVGTDENILDILLVKIDFSAVDKVN